MIMPPAVIIRCGVLISADKMIRRWYFATRQIRRWSCHQLLRENHHRLSLCLGISQTGQPFMIRLVMPTPKRGHGTQTFNEFLRSKKPCRGAEAPPSPRRAEGLRLQLYAGTIAIRNELTAYSLVIFWRTSEISSHDCLKPSVNHSSG